MRKTAIIILFLTITTLARSQGSGINAADRNADPTGKIKCTRIINNIIEELSSKGGGTLYFPAGTFLTGPIIMKSNITLWLDAGAVIKFSDDFDDYLPMVPSRWEGIRVKNFASQVYAFRCENISIRGRGHFEGQGQKWWDYLRTSGNNQQDSGKWQKIFARENAELLSKNSYLKGRNYFFRPPMITTYECKNVLIEGVSFSNPPFWTIMPAFTDNLTITGITIENPDNSPNTDGIDPSSCRNVHISNCHITVGDDCIVIKSGRDEDGREAASPTENVTITNCTMLRGHGGVVIGSEMSGNVKKIAVTNCIFDGTDRGIRIKTMRGRGGVIEDVSVSNIVMNNMVNEGILITLRYQNTAPETVSARTPSCSNVCIANIIQRGGQRPVAIYGLEERDVSQISFSNMECITRKGVLIENGHDIGFHEIKLDISEGNALELIDSRDITWDRVTVTAPETGLPLLKLVNSSNVTVTGCFQPEAVSLFLAEDEKCHDVIIANNILPATEKLFNNKGENITILNNVIKKQ